MKKSNRKRETPADKDTTAAESERIAGAETGQEESDYLPSREQLALFAAASRRKNPSDAVNYALAIWQEAGKSLATKIHDSQRRAMLREFGDIPLPKKVPATLDEFLDLVVNAETPADATKRFRDFYGETMLGHPSKPKPSKPYSVYNADPNRVPTPESWGADAIEGWKYWGFRGLKEWLVLARDYLAWWRNKKSIKASESARKRKSPT